MIQGSRAKGQKGEPFPFARLPGVSTGTIHEGLNPLESHACKENETSGPSQRSRLGGSVPEVGGRHHRKVVQDLYFDSELWRVTYLAGSGSIAGIIRCARATRGHHPLLHQHGRDSDGARWYSSPLARLHPAAQTRRRDLPSSAVRKRTVLTGASVRRCLAGLSCAGVSRELAAHSCWNAAAPVASLEKAYQVRFPAGMRADSRSGQEIAR